MKWGKMSSKYSPGLKSRVGLAALRGDKIIAELCQNLMWHLVRFMPGRKRP